eukprot:356968-Chlamydomonas_euryale.AAC.38
MELGPSGQAAILAPGRVCMPSRRTPSPRASTDHRNNSTARQNAKQAVRPAADVLRPQSIDHHATQTLGLGA